MNLRCVNCGGSDVVIGEGGRQSECARCGCNTFTRKLGNGTVTQAERPGLTFLRIEPFRGVPPERARQMFSEIHALIDSAPDVFER
jgi:predicted  nucleic acid-binding Zn-ribbon protein